MTKASDNIFPRFLVSEGGSTSTPASGQVTMYAKADGLMYSKDDAGVEKLMSAGASSGIPATIIDAKGDLIVGTAADTAARQAAGANGTVLMAASGQTNGIRWTPGLYVNYALARAVSTVTENVNSTSYVDLFTTAFAHDWDAFPATHFLITVQAFSNAAAQTITLQLTEFGSPTNPVSAGGDDLVISNNGGAITFASSGWVAVSDSMAGIDNLQLAIKGSNSTVDLSYRWIGIAFKIAS